MLKLAAVLFASTMAVSADTFVGVITDSMCGTKHESMNITPTDKCIRECVRHGDTKYVLWDGKAAWKLSDQETPAKFAAQRVKVTGKLYAKTGIIAVTSIEPAK
jgi:hypothetical protein